MSTIAVPINSSYALLQSGPIAVISVQTIAGSAEYILSPTLPADIDAGHLLGIDEGHTITLDGTDNMYIKSVAPGGAISTVAVTT